MFYFMSFTNLCSPILDPESKLQIRFPDGKKEQLNIPSSSKLMVLFPLFLALKFKKKCVVVRALKEPLDFVNSTST